MFLTLLVALLTSFASPAEDCKKCESTGVVACKRCAKDPCPEEGARPEEGVQRFCSVRLACGECEGFGSVDCRRCKIEPGPQRASEYAAGQEWLVGRREVDRFMGRELLHAESTHFVLTWDLPKIDLKKAGKPHPAMHVYLARLEELFARFAKDLGADPEKDFFGKTTVLLWDRAATQKKASIEYTRQSSTTQSKLMGATPVVSIHYDKAHLHEEPELHQAVVHQVTHCLLSNVFDGVWPGNQGAGWIDAGLAHVYEVELFGGVRHYCYAESDTMQRFKFGRWEPEVRRAVDADEALPFLGLTGKHTTELIPEAHLYAWSTVDYLLKKHPGSFGTLARALKARRPLKDALGEALSMGPFEFEAGWKAFVKSEYSLKPRRR